jgi:thiamine-monophosphate kinase
VNELELIARLLPYLASASGELVIGAGEDDAAAWREADGSYTVATCDTSVEGVHFDLGQQQPEDVGWRALAFALSDLAAKGARPTYGLVAVSLPLSWSPDTVEGMYRGVGALAGEVGLRVVGGDTTSTPGAGTLSLTCLGTTNILPRPRSAAQAGWQVAVTGALGGGGQGGPARPRPLLERGAELSAAGLCCGDVSDGLLRELDKFAMAAGVGAVLWEDAIPCIKGVAPLEALASGEEVELVCAGPAPLPADLHVVGEMTGDQQVRLIDAQGHEIEVRHRGYDHFA